jgi:hypothetical protein
MSNGARESGCMFPKANCRSALRVHCIEPRPGSRREQVPAEAVYRPDSICNRLAMRSSAATRPLRKWTRPSNVDRQSSFFLCVLFVRAIIVEDDVDFFVWWLIGQHVFEETAKILPLLVLGELRVNLASADLQGRE